MNSRDDLIVKAHPACRQAGMLGKLRLVLLNLYREQAFKQCLASNCAFDTRSSGEFMA
jgi:hypothetical protein